MTDILIYYELPQRNYDNDLLIKLEMERRGYKVAISNTFWVDLWKNMFRSPKIVMMGACRNTEELSFYDSFLKSKKRVWINLQEEQMGFSGGQDMKYLQPVGRAKEAYHFCWGQFAKDYMRDGGVEGSHIVSMGPIQFDLSKKKFDGYFADRSEIAEKYGIPKEKKWILFASDFCDVAECDNEDVVNARVEQDGEYRRVLFNFEKSACHTLSMWWEDFLQAHDDYCIIYRPHPSEYLAIDEISRLEEKYSSFYVIKDDSIKQWIHVVDVFTSWISTSVVEAYYAGIPHFSVSPENGIMYSDVSIDLYSKDKYITDYKTFEKVVLNPTEFMDDYNPLNMLELENLFGNNNDSYSYLSICDYLESILKDKGLYKKMSFCLNRDERNLNKMKGYYRRATFRNDVIVRFAPLISRFMPWKREGLKRVLDDLSRFDISMLKEKEEKLKKIIYSKN